MPETNKPTTRAAIKSILNYQWIVMNISFFLFLAFLAVLYIANGHLTDKTIRKINATQKEIKDLQFQYKTVKTDLMRKGEAIQIETAMEPYGLVVMKDMPIRLAIENKIIAQKFKNDSVK